MADLANSNLGDFLSKSGIEKTIGQYADLSEKAAKQDAASAGAQSKAVRKGMEKRKEIFSRAPEAPKAPTEYKQVSPPPQEPVGDATSVFNTFAPALAVLGSFKTRQPLVSSMNALSSAMEGYREGDKLKYERNRQIWEDKTKEALDNNKIMIDRYKNIVDQYSNDVAKMDAEMRIAALDMQDEKTIAALNNAGGAKVALKRIDDLLKIQERFSKAFKGPTTAAQSLADEIKEARDAGDIQRVKDLYLTGKLLDKGQTIDEKGNVINAPGAIPSTQQSKTAEALASKLGTEAANDIIEKKASAESAKKSIEANDRALKIIDDGIVTGAGAEYKLQFGKALRAVGFDVMGDDVANTETFVVSRAQEVANIVKQFGSGVSISNADREYAEKAAAGQISLDERSIRKILELNNDISRQALKNYKNTLSKVPKEALPYDFSVSSPDQYSLEDLEHTAKIHGITVDEVKKRLGVE